MKVAADGTMTSSFAKFLTEDEIAAIKERADMHENDVLFVVADASEETALVSLGALRCELAKRLGLAKRTITSCCGSLSSRSSSTARRRTAGRQAPPVHCADGRGYPAAGHRSG